jgi:UDP-GlcNAc:undecaprenyl-phosphate GlcNAc-1-phosphate transferase
MNVASLVTLVVPAVVAWIAIARLRASRAAQLLSDVPNERSLHASVKPRVGGLGLLAGALPVAAWFADAPVLTLIACAALLAIVSTADDRRSLPIAVRLPAHAAAAAVAILAIASPAEAREELSLVESMFALVAIVWMANLYNFMDGSDGLAGGMTLIGFGTLALAAALAGQWPLALACLAIASASTGFLAHNFPPARVFMGDAGSVPLGFLAGTLALHGTLTGAWPLAFPIIVFSPFIADATVTLARRAALGEPFWKAHRSHHYQRLVLSGWSPRRLALNAYALMVAAAATAFAVRAADGQMQLAIIAGWAAIYAVLFLAITRRYAASAG